MASSVKRSSTGVAAGAALIALLLAGSLIPEAQAGNAKPSTLVQQDAPPQNDAQLAFDPENPTSADPIHPWDNNDFGDTLNTNPGARQNPKTTPDAPVRLTNTHLLTKATSPQPGARPEQIGFLRNYPNPFNAQTRIEFALEQPGVAKLEVYNLLGQVQSRVEWIHLEAGTHSWLWSGNASNGQPVPSGVYFYRLEVNQTSAIGRMVLLK